MTDTSKEETVVTDASKTAVTPPATPPVVEPPKDNAPDAAVQQLKKELEQATMRANQLENEKKARDEAEATAKAKELEEQNQFKELHEQEKAKREALEAEIEEKEKQAELKKVKQEVLGEYSEEVRTTAEELGIDLTSADDTTVATFKEKLEKINARQGTSKPGPNNPNTPPSTGQLSGDDLRKVLQDENAFHEYITKQHPVIGSMTKPK